MTATALTVPYLDVPTQEDVMELSTDFDRHQGTDGDTDIDIDLVPDVPDQPQDQDNDYMIEDTRSEGGTGTQTFPSETGNDDIMLDDGVSQGDINEANIILDEDLDDAGDYFQDNANQDSLALQGNIDEHDGDKLQRIGQTIPQPDRVFSALADTSGAESRGHPEKEISQIQEEDVLNSLGTEDNAEVLHQSFHDTDTVDPVDSILENTRNVLDWSETPTSVGNTKTSQKSTNEDLDGGPRPEEFTSNTGSSNPRPTEPQQEQAHEATTVHPVVVIYQDAEISLFPPSDQSDSPTFFLHDEGLATGSIFDLLLACKEVLADSISEEDELELNIEELGLCISEESKSAPHTTLSQILNTYLQLLHQDGTTDIGPLYMNLRTRTSFSKRLRGLIDAAKDGKGISQLPYWDVPSDDDTVPAADGDIAYGDAEDQAEETEAPDGASDTLRSDPVDNTPTQGQHGVSKNGSVVLEPSREQDSSRLSEMERSAGTSDRHEAPTSDGILETTLLDITGSGDDESDRISPPEQAQNMAHPQIRVTSTHSPQANEEEAADLIDYENEDDPLIQDSTGSSTLAGDEAAGAANGMSIPSCDPCTQPNLCYCALCNNSFTTEDDRNGEHDPEIISLTTEPTINISNNVAVGAEESRSPTREAVQAQGDITHHKYQSQRNYQENGVDEDYELGSDEETYQAGEDDATTKPFERNSQSSQAQDLEESVNLTTYADGGDHDNKATRVPNPYHAQDLGGKASELQQSPDLNVLIDENKSETDAEGITGTRLEDTIDTDDQITDALETNQAVFEASRHELSGNLEVVVGDSEDANPYAVATISAADDDEITYDEDEIVDSPSQQTQDDHSNLETSQPVSIKRSRGENAEQDLPVDGSQGIPLDGST